MNHISLTLHAETGAGVITERSSKPVDEIVRQLEDLLAQKHIRLFATIDHGGEARRAGLTMPPTKLLIFGSPHAGTPIMLASPSSAIDLPLKILVAEDEKGAVSVSYNSPAYLQTRHGIADELIKPLSGVADLVRQVL